MAATNAVFNVITNNTRKEGNKGDSWGVVTVLNDGLYTFYLSSPVERGRIMALQTVGAKFFDHF